jgi:hypothetical protein
VVQIELGGGTACAVTRDGRLLCWGANNLGKVGDGTQIDRFTPVEIVF